MIADVESVTRQLEGLYADGFRSIAVCLLHSFTFQKHEQQVEEVAQRIGFTQVSVSSQLQPMSVYLVYDRSDMKADHQSRLSHAEHQPPPTLTSPPAFKHTFSPSRRVSRVALRIHTVPSSRLCSPTGVSPGSTASQV